LLELKRTYWCRHRRGTESNAQGARTRAAKSSWSAEK
jgi:hypothetical protein